MSVFYTELKKSLSNLLYFTFNLKSFNSFWYWYDIDMILISYWNDIYIDISN